MAGIYIHIPFCRQACHYCDFHFSTNLSLQNDMVDGICKEIQKRHAYIEEQIDTIYFGGGTPSVLSNDQLKKIISCVRQVFEVSDNPEISLEANPEDLVKEEKLESLLTVGINRLSIGTQTFSNDRLNWMNRIHDSDQAIDSYRSARKVGFKNISLDLIYAIPDGGEKLWEEDLNQLGELQPEHVSLYGLTIEERTVFGSRKAKGQMTEVDEEKAAEQYLKSINMLRGFGYEQYEVSNFCKPGFESRHNSSYWSGKPYLGFGPGAHSFDGNSRQFNIRNNAKYLKLLSSGDPFYEREILSKEQRMNEMILTRLRTTQGLDLKGFAGNFSLHLPDIKSEIVDRLTKQELVNIDDGYLALTTSGFLVADEVALQLFFDE